ncbi:MAG TPA: ABC transporter ATP-binding protein [Ensifer sp.]|nr:ABC transporter ATP-binding protein [Ensifer sp.]
MTAQTIRETSQASRVGPATVGISVNGLTHRFGAGRQATLALQNVQLDIAPGEFHCLLGPSGCGKSTLLYLIGGFIPVQEGTIRTARGAVTRPGVDRGIVFQNFALFPWKTVRQNVLYGMENLGVAKAEREARAADLLAMVKLEKFANHYPSQLSGGMQQRAAIARTLAIEPDILLMDEPFGALDAQTRSVMQEELISIWQRTGKIIVFVTHDVQEAVLLGDRISVMSARPGRIETIVSCDFNREKGSPVRRAGEFAEQVQHLSALMHQQALT